MNKYKEWLKSGRKKIYNNAADKPRLSFMHVSSLVVLLLIFAFYGYSFLRMIYTPKIKQLERQNVLVTPSMPVDGGIYFDYSPSTSFDVGVLLSTPMPDLTPTPTPDLVPTPTPDVVPTPTIEYLTALIPVPQDDYDCSVGIFDQYFILECWRPGARR